MNDLFNIKEEVKNKNGCATIQSSIICNRISTLKDQTPNEKVPPTYVSLHQDVGADDLVLEEEVDGGQ